MTDDGRSGVGDGLSFRGLWSVVRRLWPLLLLLLLLAAFALRAHRIGDQRVWWDEGWSVWAARLPLAGILRETGHDVHPPLYFVLLHVWRAGSGDSEAGLRLLSAYLGLLTVAATYALGRAMARGTLPPGAARAVGGLAALLLAISRFAIAWSQEIRMYALATLLAVLAVWAARRVWAGRGRGSAVVYVLATAAGLYTLYLFGLVWAAINVAWLLGVLWQRRRALAPPLPRSSAPLRPLAWLALQLVIAALFAPWALYAAGGFLSTAAATPIRLLDFLHIYWTVLTVGIPVDVAQFNRLTLPALAILVVALVALGGRIRNWELGIRNGGGWRVARGEGRVAGGGFSPAPPPPRSPAPPRDLALLLAILLLPALVVYFISLPKQNFYNPPFNPRYLVIFTPFYSILLAWGLGALGSWGAGVRGRGGAGENPPLATRHAPLATRHAPLATRLLALILAAFMLAVALVGLWPYYPGRVRVDDYPSLVSTLAAYRRPADSVVLYTDTDWPIFAFHHPRPWRGVPHLWAMTPALAEEFLAPVWQDHDAVWLVTTPYSATGDPQRAVPAWLAERATAVRQFAYDDMALTLYTRTAARAAAADALAPDAPAPRPLAVTLAPDARLTGFTQATRDFVSGDIAHLFLFYAAPDGGAATVGLLDGAGDLWAETTTPLPPAAAGRQQVDVRLPPEAPAGRYRFAVRDADGRLAPFGELTLRQKSAALLTEADVTIAQRLDTPFAQGVRLLGYDLAAATARPGEAVGLTLYWSSDGGLTTGYKVFTHLLGDTFNAAGGNFLWGQSDAEPAANTRPTTTWRAGEVIVDAHLIPVAADAPPGTYTIEIGLYEPVSGARLPVLGPDGAPAGDAVIVTTVEVQQ